MSELTSEKRKQDHWNLCAGPEVAFRNKTTLLEQVELVHLALPEMSLDEVNTETTFLGKKLAAPLWLSSMTGGMAGAKRSNLELAEIAEKLGLGFCLGSMRPILTGKKFREDFQVREAAPTTLVMCNIGGTAVIQSGVARVVDETKELGANGLIVHLNPAMELVQPGGDEDFRGVLDAIGRLVEEANGLEICVKETGAGLSWKDARALKRLGVRTVEVGGSGGTSWVGVETLRASGIQEKIGHELWDWGIPTAAATLWCAREGLDVVAGGGVRSGLDIARALSLGARLAGVAAPLVEHMVNGGPDAVEKYLTGLVSSLRAAMLLCGARTPDEMADVPAVLGPELERWSSLHRANSATQEGIR